MPILIKSLLAQMPHCNGQKASWLAVKALQLHTSLICELGS